MGPFPEDVARFLYENVGSIDELEILRLLGEDRQREWDAAALAVEVQAEPEDVLAHLSALRSRGLLATATRGACLVCRYGVDTPELEEMVGRLLRLYKERPVTMIKMVYRRDGHPRRSPADAPRPGERR